MKEILKLIRVKQWVKNIFIFLPIFFAGDIEDIDKLQNAIIAFFVFCFTASAIYIINDYVDIKQDQKHPEKKSRPLAAGTISKKEAWVIFAILILLAIAGLSYLGEYRVSILIGFYFVMNLAYSFKLKHVAILDIMIIAFGFLLRVFVGGYATGIVVTPWTQVLVFCLALIMAIGKRRGELVNAGIEGKTRKALDGYNIEFANAILVVASTVTIVSYLMFCLSPDTIAHFGNYIFYTFLLVFAGILRYLQQTFVYNRTESPTKMVYRDHFLQAIVLLYVAAFVILIYMKQ